MNAVLGGMVSKFLGELNLAEGYRQRVGLNPLRSRTRTYHVINGWDVAHRGGVTRSRLDLLAIAKGLADTEVDKVVPRRL